MKTWHWIALGIGVAAVALYLRSRGSSGAPDNFVTSYAPPAVPASGPGIEARRGAGHF